MRLAETTGRESQGGLGLFGADCKIEGDKTMKRLWKFELALEGGQTLYVGGDGNPDSASMFAAEEDEARKEAIRRIFKFETVHGVTPDSVRYESHGKANNALSVKEAQ